MAEFLIVLVWQTYLIILKSDQSKLEPTLRGLIIYFFLEISCPTKCLKMFIKIILKCWYIGMEYIEKKCLFWIMLIWTQKYLLGLISRVVFEILEHATSKNGPTNQWGSNLTHKYKLKVRKKYSSGQT